MPLQDRSISRASWTAIAAGSQGGRQAFSLDEMSGSEEGGAGRGGMVLVKKPHTIEMSENSFLVSPILSRYSHATRKRSPEAHAPLERAFCIWKPNPLQQRSWDSARLLRCPRPPTRDHRLGDILFRCLISLVRAQRFAISIL